MFHDDMSIHIHVCGGGVKREIENMKRLLLIVIPITFIFCLLSVSHFSFFEFLELKSLDVQFGLRGAVKPDPRIIIAAIDEKSLDDLGQWPWPRSKLASLVRNLREAGAKVIAFDVVFAEADRLGFDRILADELAKTPGAVLGYFFDKDKKVSNVPELENAAAGGYFNTYPDRDGIVRRMPLLFEGYGGKSGNSLALGVVSKFYGFTPFVKRDGAGNCLHIIVGEKAIPVDASCRMMINYPGRPGTFPYISVSDIISGRFKERDLKDAIVLVGASAAGLSDQRPTPFSSAHAGVEIHASIADNILTGRYLKRTAASEVINLAGLLLIGLLSLFILARLNIAWAITFQSLLIITILGIGYWQFVGGLWFPIVYLVLEALCLFIAVMLFRYFTEGREKKAIHRAFKFYLAPQVIDGLLKDTSKLKLGGERREITILFSDVRNFTTISEGLDPAKLVSLMNEYFTCMTDIIMEEGGMVDKYIGDAIMAIFGAPAEQADHAEKACRAALRMFSALAELEPVLCKKYGIGGFKIGIGINTGIAHVGNMGSSNRFNYTAIGDAVNVASRLEGLTKEYKTPIIVSSATKCGCGASFNFSPLGGVQVKGKLEKLEVFGLCFI